MQISLARSLETPGQQLTRLIRSKRFAELRQFWLDYTKDGSDYDATRQLCWCDRYFLLVAICKREDAFREWIFDRCREVEADPDEHLDLWARTHYKSTIITFAGIIQEILRDPEITVAIFSHTKPIAKAFLRQIQREFEANEDLKALFPKILWSDPEKEARQWSLDGGITVKRKGNPKEATVEAHGLIDGQPTSRHFKLRVYNDVVVPESVATPEQIEKTTDAWSLSDNLGMRGGRRWHEGTRYHYADTYSVIMTRGITPRIHAATDDGTMDGNPVLLSRPEWEKMLRTQSDSTIACQQLLNPLAGTQKMFNVGDLQTYEVRPLTLMGYLLIDPARSVKKDSANTAMMVLGLDYAGNKYLLDGIDHKVDLMDRWRWMRDLRDKWINAPGMAGFHVGYEKFGAQADLDYFHERMRIEKNNFDIVELAWPRDGEGSKPDRVQRLVPDIKGHRFYLPYPTDEENLTRVQRTMKEQGYDYRIAQPIERLDENGNKYDLTERVKLCISYFPYGGRVDTVDAISRIYDMEPVVPEHVEQTSLEPEHV